MSVRRTTDRLPLVFNGFLVKGLDNNQIAGTLIVSRSTVKFHVSNILSKLQAASRTEAVVVALQHNLVLKS
jgi:NarL family two-component system response regulator LiaR